MAIFALNVPFPIIVLSAAFIGFIGGRLSPERFRGGAAHAGNDKSYGPAVIDDDTPAPDHAVFSWSRLLWIVIIGALLWAIPMGTLYFVLG